MVVDKSVDSQVLEGVVMLYESDFFSWVEGDMSKDIMFLIINKNGISTDQKTKGIIKEMCLQNLW